MGRSLFTFIAAYFGAETFSSRARLLSWNRRVHTRRRDSLSFIFEIIIDRKLWLPSFVEKNRKTVVNKMRLMRENIYGRWQRFVRGCSARQLIVTSFYWTCRRILILSWDSLWIICATQRVIHQLRLEQHKLKSREKLIRIWRQAYVWDFDSQIIIACREFVRLIKIQSIRNVRRNFDEPLRKIFRQKIAAFDQFINYVFLPPHSPGPGM